MVVSLSEIRRAFDDLVAGGRSREEIADWAESARRADDDGRLSFEPEADRDRIWRALLYLTGVDLKTSPSEHLHSTEDFVEFREKAGV